MTERSLPRLSYNFITICGAVIAGVSAVTGTVLLLVGLFEHDTNPYFGIFLYGIIPAILIIGLLLIPLGIYREWRKEKRGVARAPLKWPNIDLNNGKHRRATFIFVFGTAFFIIISAVGSYKAYHYSESVEFCGTTCHGVMKPEYVAHENSPHARVACVACHVGEGVGWYAKSKINGMHQVYSLIASKYSRPIGTPVKNMRPAQETCEQCHWPQKFFGSQQKQFTHYMYDSANTLWPINMLLKVGGGDPKTGQTAGIHWHMNIANKIEYIAADDARQDIRWVQATNKQTGQVTVYQSSGDSAFSAEQIATMPKRTMDCIDCHNRPAHIYASPDRTVDEVMLIAQIDTILPDIKRIAVEAMSAEYETENDALTAIADKIGNYYETTYPELYQSKRATVDAAIKATQEAFSKNFFPEMKVRWSAYPSNIGHFFSAGCMRCHNEKMQTTDGRHITTDCTACHTILSQGSGSRFASSTTQDGLLFEHPADIGDEWKNTGCFECHSGTQP